MATSNDNSYSALVHKQVFDAGVQDELRDMTYFRDIADVRTDDGENIYNRYGSDIAARSTTDDTYSASTFSYDKDVLGLDYTAYNAEHISMDEMVKEGFMIQADRVDRHAESLARKVNRDTAVATYENAGQVLDNEVLAGGASAGTPITLSDTNPDEVATKVTQLLQQQNAMSSIMGSPYMVMRPADARNFGLYAMNSGNNVGDTSILGGFKYSNFFGFDIFVTNDVPQTVAGTATTNFSASDTVTVAGVVFTFVASPSATGDVDLGGDVDTSLSNLAAAINGGAGAGTAYVELSAGDRTTLRNLNVKAVAGTGTLDVTAAGTIAAAETATGDFAWGAEKAHILCGGRGTTVLRLPEGGYHSKVLDQIDGFLGIQLRTAQKYDHTIWTKNKPKVVNVEVAA